MSKFYLIEFQPKKRSGWRPWARKDVKTEALEEAKELVRLNKTLPSHVKSFGFRVVRINTDAEKIEYIWNHLEGKHPVWG